MLGELKESYTNGHAPMILDMTLAIPMPPP